MTVHYGYPDPDAPDAQKQEAPQPVSNAVLLPGQTLKGRVEAVLFMTGKALTLHDIAQMIDAPYEETEFALMELMGDYNFREESSLEIDDTDGYILHVKEAYGDIVNKMMPLEMSAAELRTLSAIAIKAPVLQSDLIEWRGATAYDHIANLLKRKLITKRREGRSYILNVTRNFHEYFKLTADKKDLAHLVKLIGKEEKTEPNIPDIERHAGDYEDARFDAFGNPL